MTKYSTICFICFGFVYAADADVDADADADFVYSANSE